MQEANQTRFCTNVPQKDVEWTNVLCDQCNSNQGKKVCKIFIS